MPRVTLSKIANEVFADAVARSNTYRQVLRNLGINMSGSSSSAVRNRAEKLGLDTSHMIGHHWRKGLKLPTSNKAMPLVDILAENSHYNLSRLRERMIAAGLKERKCEICNNTIWMNKLIPLQVHHVNGDRTDNRIENITVVCPNCHAQTDTYCGRNIERLRKV
jgi:hypothetical protein